MDVYPLNLILAVATASATIFLGFLPTKNIRFDFFARETWKTAAAWVFVALTSPPAILHYPLIIAFLCASSWWHFRRDNALSGKMWLSIASGLGISLGVMLILAVTPRAYPPGLSQLNETLLLASIYLGGSVIGMAYVCYVLTKSVSMKAGITSAVVRRYINLLLFLVLVRAVVLLGIYFCSKTLFFGAGMPQVETHETRLDGFIRQGEEIPLLLGLVVVILPTLAFLAQRATKLNSRILPTRYLAALILLGILAETLARLLVL